MAVGQVDPQFSQVHTLGVTQGIKRDGTVFESREYSDGVWCRFQRGTPKKMGGYRQLFNSFSGIPRGFITNPYNGVNYSFAGTQVGLDVFTTGTTLGAGSGPFNAIFRPGYSKFPITGDTITNTTTSFVIDSNALTPINYTSVYPPGTKVIFTQSGTPTVYTVTTSTFATPNTTVNFTPAVGGSVVISNVWIYNEFFEPDPRLMWQFDFQYDPSGGALKLLAHPGLNLQNIDNGVNTAIYYGDTLPNSSAQWTFDVLADSTGQNPTYLPISVDGGVCCLYPFIFAYGSNGFISNNNVDTTYADQTPTDWNGPLANQVNMSASKIVKGMPTRGGTNAPSGLFWALDSLIRTSFTGAAPNYWRYDIVSSQISIMSSAAVVEMDGTYYWMGVDRFYAYNGSVTVVPNDKNVNWLFDNLNYTQRQKVWATKVPRYNEIWFFYPRNTATECTDAIIYNVKDKIWYDAGQATGAQRSCGYTTEIFPTPVWCDWNYNVEYSQGFNTINAVPLGLTPPTPFQIYVAGDQSQVFSPGDYLTFSNTPNAPAYQVVTAVFLYNTSTNPLPGCTLITVETEIDPYPTVGQLFYMVTGGYAIWQHEFGLNKVTFLDESAIQSSFTTCDISWVGGTPSQDTAQGVNRRMHLRRIEPDFVQVGPMTLDIIGRKFASGESEEISGPFAFDENTPKIDLRVEHREARLKFESNTINGNYEMGRILITAEYGDERP